MTIFLNLLVLSITNWCHGLLIILHHSHSHFTLNYGFTIAVWIFHLCFFTISSCLNIPFNLSLSIYSGLFSNQDIIWSLSCFGIVAPKYFLLSHPSVRIGYVSCIHTYLILVYILYIQIGNFAQHLHLNTLCKHNVSYWKNLSGNINYTIFIGTY